MKTTTTPKRGSHDPEKPVTSASLTACYINQYLVPWPALEAPRHHDDVIGFTDIGALIM